MKNKEVKEYLEKNANESVYMADELTKEGYGQTVGAYHNEAKKHNVKKPTQKWHFTVSYYNSDKAENYPTFNKLHCPELLIWIAEVAGLNKDIISRSCNYIKDFENKNHLKGTEKDGNYIRPIETEFKELLHINDINNIIGNAANWEEVTQKVSLIK